MTASLIRQIHLLIEIKQNPYREDIRVNISRLDVDHLFALKFFIEENDLRVLQWMRESCLTADIITFDCENLNDEQYNTLSDIASSKKE